MGGIRGRIMASSGRDKILFAFASLYLFAVGVWWWQKQKNEKAKTFHPSTSDSTPPYDNTNRQSSYPLEPPHNKMVVINPPLDLGNPRDEETIKVKGINKRDLEIPPLPPLPSLPKISPPPPPTPPIPPTPPTSPTPLTPPPPPTKSVFPSPNPPANTNKPGNSHSQSVGGGMTQSNKASSPQSKSSTATSQSAYSSSGSQCVVKSNPPCQLSPRLAKVPILNPPSQEDTSSSTANTALNSQSNGVIAETKGNKTLVGIVQLPDNSSVALFKINDITEKVPVGGEIGNSGWVLMAVDDKQALISRQNQFKSLLVGESF